MADDESGPKPSHKCPEMRAEYEALAALKAEAAKRDAARQTRGEQGDDTSLATLATLFGDTSVA